jgi:hypothetical protein
MALQAGESCILDFAHDLSCTLLNHSCSCFEILKFAVPALENLHSFFFWQTLISFFRVDAHLQLNYPYFIGFISTSTTLCIYVFVFSWFNVLRQQGTSWSIMSHDVLSVVLIAYCFVAVWFVGGLTLFHLYLISTNQVWHLQMINRI